MPGFILKQRRVDFLTAQECEFKTVHKNIDNSCIISALVLLKYSLLQCYMEHISTTHMILSFQSYQQERHVECKQWSLSIPRSKLNYYSFSFLSNENTKSIFLCYMVLTFIKIIIYLDALKFKMTRIQPVMYRILRKYGIC